MVSLSDVLGVLMLSVVVSGFLAIANVDEFKGMSGGKGLGMMTLLLVMTFLMGIGIYFGVVLIAS